MKPIKHFLAVAATFTFGLLTAQETQNLGPLVTDRPDATEAPSVVPKNYIQVETGAFYESFEDNNLKTEDFTYNTTLIRYGLLDNLELRLGWNLTDSKAFLNNTETSQISSFSPLLLGVKIAITQEDGLLPEIGFIGHLNLPFSVKEAIRPQTTGVDFRFSFAHTLSERSSFSYNLGAAWGGDSPEANYLYTMAYGYSITEKFGAYAELYGDFPENSKANHLWDAGLTYLLSNNVQLDATVGSRITKGQDILLSAGISFRLPN
ncbi:transporter [Olleya sp. YS]|uniref:transporter n=1 Tax=Olleya sp. YS TaxID=3028318 RepID=UPI0024343749|nr:transporter [Olleya sp. YS]WGD35668.1 transporter [Olleya sp. YS]